MVKPLKGNFNQALWGDEHALEGNKQALMGYGQALEGN